MKLAYLLLVLLLMITVSCSDEQILLEKPPISGGSGGGGLAYGGGLSFSWSMSQDSSGDHVWIVVSYILKISLHEEVSGEISSSNSEISEEDWDRVKILVQGVFANRPSDTLCDCCDETLSYSERLDYVHGCIIDSRRIEGCADEDIELVRDLYKELKEKYFSAENKH